MLAKQQVLMNIALEIVVIQQQLPEKELQDILAEFTGYVFTKRLKLEKALLLYRTGANGKSVYFDVMNALLEQI